MITILHVDDDLVDQELARIKLHRLERDLAFFPVKSVEAALHELRNTAFDCIISDFQMPGQSGMDFLRELRANGDDTPFIFLTGQGNEQIAAEALRSGASDYFTKNEGFAHYDRLLNAIRNVVRAQSLTRDRSKAETRYRAVFETGIAGIYQTTLDGKIQLVNPALLHMFGYDSIEELGDAPGLYVDPQDRSVILRDLREARQVLVENVRFRRKDGSIMWGMVNARLDGDIMHGTIIDTTEKYLAAEALHTTQEKYRRIVETANEAIVTTDSGGKITFANEHFSEMIGYSLDQIIGRPVSRFMLEEDREEHFQRNAQLRDGKPQTFERRYRHRDGSIRWFLVSLSPQIDQQGELQEILALLTDITGRREMEEALRISEGRVRAKLDAILLPEGDISTLDMADILDIAAIQKLMDSFFAITGLPVAFIDNKGTVLIAIGWQSICTRFHRNHPETQANCIECDLVLSRDVTPGTYKTYQCKNGLWDVVTPIVVGTRKVGNLFTGQFFYEDTPPDRDRFREQARRFGFEEKEYLEALDEVPTFSRFKIEQAMSFYMRLADMVSKLSYGNLKLARTAEALRESEAKFHSLFKSMNEGMMLHELVTDEAGTVIDYRILDMNDAAVKILDVSRDDFVGGLASEVYGTGAAPYLDLFSPVAISGTPTSLTLSFEPLGKDFHVSVFSPRRGQFATIFTDITERVRQERSQLFVDAILQLFVAETDRRRMYDEIAANVASYTGFSYCTVQKYDVACEQMLFLGIHGFEPPGNSYPLAIPIDESLSGEIVRRGRLFKSSELSSHTGRRSQLLRDLKAVSFIGIPLFAEGRVIGALCCADREQRTIDDQKLETLRFIGGSLAQVLVRQEIEQSLRENEAQLGLAIEGSAVGLWDWRVQTGEVIFNKRWADMAGYTLDELAPLSIQTWKGLCQPDDLEKSIIEVKRHFAGEIPAYEAECRMRHKDGSWIWILDRGKVVERDENGNPLRMVGTHLDITERKNSEQALRESENRYRLILESAPNPVLLMRDMRYIWANPAGIRLLGYTSIDEIIGLPIEKTIAPELMAEIKKRFKRIRQGVGNPLIDLIIIQPDGTRVVAQANSTPIMLSDGPAALVMGIDITERLRIEQDLRKSEVRYRELFENAPVGIFATTSEGQPLVANPAMARILGFSNVEEALSRYTDLARHLYVQPERRSEFIKLIKEKGSVENFEYEARTADGHQVWIGMNARISEQMPDGKFTIEGFATDITERKRATDALEKRIYALTQPLEEASAIDFECLFDLEQLQQLQDEFANATGVSSIITHPDGRPITQPSNFRRFCRDIIRQTEGGRADCFRSDSLWGRLNPDGPVVKPCLGPSLWEAGAGISVGGHHIANWLIGQVRNETQTEDHIRAYADEIGADIDATLEAFREVPTMSREQFESVARALFTLANQLSTAAFQNVQQARFITELRKAEESLRERAAQYRAVVETSADGFWVADHDGYLLEVNDAYVQRSGYSREELLRMRVADLEASEDPQETAVHNQKVVATGSDIFETRHRAKDGTVWQVEINASYWPISGGRFFAFLRDIWRRKQSEVILRTRLKLIDMARTVSIDEIMQETLDTAELLTGSVIGFFHFVDTDQENLTLNAWSRNTVKNMCDAEGKGMHYPISSAGVWVDCFHERKPVIHNDYASLPHRKGLPEGHASIARELTVPIIHGDLVAAILGVGNKATDYTQEDVDIIESLAIVALDVIENKRRDMQLNLQSQALEAAANGIVLTDRTGVIQWANKAFSTLTGYPVDEACGLNSSLLKSGAHDDAFYRRMWETISHGEVWRGEVINRRKDGRLYTEEMTITPVIGVDGTPTHYIAIKQDVSARHALQQARDDSAALFRSLAENSPDYIMRYDRAGRHIYVNPATVRVSGLSAEDFQDKTHRELGFPPDLCARWEADIESVFESGRERSEIFEWKGVEDAMTLHLRLIPERGTDGTVQTVLGISRDITAILKGGVKDPSVA